MHRNVFFKDKVAAVPFSSFDSIYPEDLWTYLEIQRNQGIEVFAIPHNSNVSNGWMFSERKFLEGPIDARYARRQAANEPLFEMAQTKGTSETHPVVSPNDEFADFEPFDNLISNTSALTLARITGIGPASGRSAAIMSARIQERASSAR